MLDFYFKKKTYERTKRHCFNAEQQKDIEIKGFGFARVPANHRPVVCKINGWNIP